jgi:hypothetical protein
MRKVLILWDDVVRHHCAAQNHRDLHVFLKWIDLESAETPSVLRQLSHCVREGTPGRMPP